MKIQILNMDILIGKEWYMNNDVTMNIGSNALATLQNNRNIDKCRVEE